MDPNALADELATAFEITSLAGIIKEAGRVYRRMRAGKMDHAEGRVTKFQLDRLEARVEATAVRLGKGKRTEYKLYLSFAGKVEADENGAPVKPIHWITKYRDGQPVDEEDGRLIEYVTHYSETPEDLIQRHPELRGRDGKCKPMRVVDFW